MQFGPQVFIYCATWSDPDQSIGGSVCALPILWERMGDFVKCLRQTQEDIRDCIFYLSYLLCPLMLYGYEGLGLTYCAFLAYGREWEKLLGDPCVRRGMEMPSEKCRIFLKLRNRIRHSCKHLLLHENTYYYMRTDFCTQKTFSINILVPLDFQQFTSFTIFALHLHFILLFSLRSLRWRRPPTPRRLPSGPSHHIDQKAEEIGP